MKLVKCSLLVLECDSKAIAVHRAVIKPPCPWTQRGSDQ
jgi:predicted small metal-binding protein